MDVQSLPTAHEVAAAAQRIAPWVRRTPSLRLVPGALGLRWPLVVKLELLQRSGSFKARGAFAMLTAAPVPAAGVVTASGGNHGAAVADAAAALGHRAEVFVPERTPQAKRRRLVELGACVTSGGASYAEAAEAAHQRAAATGALYVPAFDHPLVVAGQGTLLAELVSDTPVDCALVAVGGGGLLGGCLAAGGARVIGVETHGTQSMRRALDAGSVVDTELSGLAVDSLGARRVGALPLALAQAHRAEVVLVSDEALRHAQQLLWRELRLAVEPAAAAGLAALVTGAYAPPAGATVGVILCGGNVDPCSLSAPLAGS